MVNFEHKLEAVLESTAQQTNYLEIQNISKKLMNLNKEQIDLHQLNEVKEKLTQDYL